MVRKPIHLTLMSPCSSLLSIAPLQRSAETEPGGDGVAACIPAHDGRRGHADDHIPAHGGGGVHAFAGFGAVTKVKEVSPPALLLREYAREYCENFDID